MSGRNPDAENRRRNTSVAPVAIAGNTIDDRLTVTVKKRNAVTLVADGQGGWPIIGQAGA